MSSEQKLIMVKTSDGETFELQEEVANQSQTMKHMIEDGCADSVIPLPNVSANIMAKVIEYCKHHAKPAASNDDRVKDDEESFDSAFMVPIKADLTILHDVLMAANYLDIKGLLDLTTQTIADMIKGKSPQEIRDIFRIKNDFSPEVEAEVRRENAWAYDE